MEQIFKLSISIINLKDGVAVYAFMFMCVPRVAATCVAICFRRCVCIYRRNMSADMCMIVVCSCIITYIHTYIYMYTQVYIYCFLHKTPEYRHQCTYVWLVT